MSTKRRYSRRKKEAPKEHGESFFKASGRQKGPEAGGSFFSSVQTKLKIGAPGDKHEKQADAMADKVVNTPVNPKSVQTKESDSKVQRQGTEEEAQAKLQRQGEEEEVQTQVQKQEEEETQAKLQKQEEEEAQAKLQKQEEEEAQPKLQKQEEEEAQAKLQRQEEEEPAQAKLQKQEEEEAQAKLQKQEEEETQAKLQKQEEEEAQPKLQKQEEEEAQAKLQRQEEEEPAQAKLQRKEEADATPDFEMKLAGTKGGGSPMPKDVRDEMEQKFGTSFKRVKIHSDSESYMLCEEINAQAFTRGNHIYFNKGKFSPGTKEGKLLLAHELTHVVQQRGPM